MENFKIENHPNSIKYFDFELTKNVESKYDKQYLTYIILITVLWLFFFTAFTISIFQCSQCFNFLFVLFVIPFWILIFCMIFYIIKILFGKIEIHVSEYHLSVTKSIGSFTKVKIYKWPDIKDVKLIVFKFYPAVRIVLKNYKVETISNCLSKASAKYVLNAITYFIDNANKNILY
jgi:hypothetical protein